jgi:hypothetical protein
MAVTIVDRRTIISEADTTTGWTGAGFGTSTGDFAEATACVAEAINIGSGSLYFTPAAAIDLSTQLVYVYSFNNALQPSWTSWPNSLYLSDGTNDLAFAQAGTDRRVFNHVEGPTNWQCFVLDLEQASTVNSQGYVSALTGTFASFSSTAVSEIGSYFVTQSKALGGGYNVAVDIMRHGNDGIFVVGGTTASYGTFDELAAADRGTATQQAHGIFREYTAGAYGCQGPLTFGRSTSTADTYFSDSAFVVVFEDRFIGDDKYYIATAGSTTGQNEVIWDGGTITTAGPFVTIDLSDSNVEVLSISNVTFSELGNAVLLSTGSTGPHSITNTVFTNVGKITAGTVTFTGNSVLASNSTLYAIEAGGGTMTGLTLSGYEGDSGSAALLWDISDNPDGKLDDSSFT